jgi:prepilin-type N-terminal cleavage/methylation domain-containing protein
VAYALHFTICGPTGSPAERPHLLENIRFGALTLPYLVKKLVSKFVTFETSDQKIEGRIMVRGKNEGFSLIELLIVVVVIGIIAALAVPMLQKGIRASENGNTFASMRTIASTQVNFYSQNNRFARLSEINNLLSNSIGTPSGNDVLRGKFTLSMVPATPTDAQLRDGYTITATRNITGEGVVYQYEVNQAGEIRQILP